MTAIVPYQFDTFDVRVQMLDGQPWFVTADLCAVLGIGTHRDTMSRVDADERGSLLVDTPGGQQRVGAVNESGMWKLVLKSRKPAAKRLVRWLTSDVLPSIRRTGTYGAPALALDLNNPAVLQRLLLDHTKLAMAAEARVAELAPKAEALALLTEAGGSIAPTYAAKVLGVKPGKLFDWLEANRWLYRGVDGLVGYQPRIDAGLIEHKAERIDRPRRPPKFVNRALITPKGIAKLAELGAGRE